MNISYKGLAIIKLFEGYVGEAYLDSAHIWTIGYGTIKYPDGTKVKENDCCSEQEADDWLLNHLAGTIKGINNLVWNKPLNQNQFDAICSFVYNLGLGALTKSTLYAKARQNPDDETIYKYDPAHPAQSCEFTKWITVKGKVIQGLLNRRIKEADLYGEKLNLNI